MKTHNCCEMGIGLSLFVLTFVLTADNVMIWLACQKISKPSGLITISLSAELNYSEPNPAKKDI